MLVRAAGSPSQTLRACSDLPPPRPWSPPSSSQVGVPPTAQSVRPLASPQSVLARPIALASRARPVHGWLLLGADGGAVSERCFLARRKVAPFGSISNNVIDGTGRSQRARRFRRSRWRAALLRDQGAVEGVEVGRVCCLRSDRCCGVGRPPRCQPAGADVKGSGNGLAVASVRPAGG